jgi:thiol-disulfide isomerase/thioredoxin
MRQWGGFKQCRWELNHDVETRKECAGSQQNALPLHQHTVATNTHYCGENACAAPKLEDCRQLDETGVGQWIMLLAFIQFFQVTTMLHRFLILVVTCCSFCVVTTAFAEERTLEEFIEYSTRRIGKSDSDAIVRFAEAVDANGDGTVSDKEFAGRIDAYQLVFQTVQPSHAQKGHSLPDNWFSDFEKATAEAKKTDRPMLVMFSASWCAPCKMMIAQVFPDEKVKAALKGVVPVYIDSEVNVQLATENGIQAYPTFVCFSSNGQSVTSRVGGGDVPNFIELVETFKLAADAAKVPE